MNHLPHLAARVIGTPLMVERARLETILSVIAPRIGIEPMAMPSGFEESDRSTGLTIILYSGTISTFLND